MTTGSERASACAHGWPIARTIIFVLPWKPCPRAKSPVCGDSWKASIFPSLSKNGSIPIWSRIIYCSALRSPARRRIAQLALNNSKRQESNAFCSLLRIPTMMQSWKLGAAGLFPSVRKLEKNTQFIVLLSCVYANLTYNQREMFFIVKEMFVAINFWRLLVIAVMLHSLASTDAFAAEKSTESNVVKDGTVVSLEYTLSGEDGKTIESNKGKDPLKYTQGSHQIVPGLEKELAGMKMGEEKRVKVMPEEGYGPVDPKGFQEFPKEKIPTEGLKVGAVLMARGPQGQQIPVRVHEIKEKTVVLDLNHPMAGKTLVFDVKVLDVQPATAQQLQPMKPTGPAQPAKPAQPTQPK